MSLNNHNLKSTEGKDMRAEHMIILFLLSVILIGFYSCQKKEPDYSISKDFGFIEDKTKSLIRSVTIKQSDRGNNFIGEKNIYKNPNSIGKSRIYLFSDNEGYYFNGDTFQLRKGFVYNLYIRTLGFSDTLVFTPK